MRITADLALHASSPSFRLPGSGSRSIVIAVAETGAQFGAVIVTSDGSDLSPGARVADASIAPWVEDVHLPPIVVGDRLTLWMGGDVGEGTVTSVER